MPFTAGELCCSSKACVLIARHDQSQVTTYDKIPHVTNISVQLQSNNPKLVTSSTKGKETSACGTVTQTGTLELACHKGDGPGLLNVNNIYELIWSQDCDNIWNSTTCQHEFSGDYLQAYIRITQLPINFNISGNQAQLYSYQFEIVSWVTGPDSYEQTPEVVTTLFGC